MAANDDFYVGYLPAPVSHRRVLQRVVPGLVIALVVAAGAAAWAQRSPGSGVWHDDVVSEWSGTVTNVPYPMLIVDGDRDPARTFLLVDTGKRGAQQRTAALDGKAVTLKGTLIERDGRRLIEIDGDAGAIVPKMEADRASVVPAIERRAVGTVELVGEIVDPKCFLGAMKPGDGWAHQCCAMLCIMGGIPPMLAVAPEDAGGRPGATRYVLLASSKGAAVNLEIVPLVASRVRVVGREVVVGDLTIVEADVASMVRVP